jgi:hypothetical protein
LLVQQFDKRLWDSRHVWPPILDKDHEWQGVLFGEALSRIKPIAMSNRSHNGFLGLGNCCWQILVDPSAFPEHPRAINESFENATELRNLTQATPKKHSKRKFRRLKTIDFQIELWPIAEVAVENNLPRTRRLRPHRGNQYEANFFHYQFRALDR